MVEWDWDNQKKIERMVKIKSLFKRDHEGTRKVYDEVVQGCEWVLNGEGVATRKYDGTCCKIEGGKIFKRYDAKNGKTPPPGFIPAQDPDPKTGHWPGWVEVSEDDPADKYHVEAFKKMIQASKKFNVPVIDGTYELCGPKINGNPESFDMHILVPHGDAKLVDVPRAFEGIKSYLKDRKIEGIVWHHPDGRMCKIKKKDFHYQ